MTDRTRLTATDLALTLPDGWEQVAVGGADLVIAFPERPDGSFRPNLVVMREPSTEPVTAASSAAIAASLVIHPGAHVLDVALAHAGGVGGVLEGRRIVYGYDTEATWVVVHQWVFATGSAHVNLTASCAVEDTPFVSPHFDGVVAGVVFGDGETPGAVPDSEEGTR